MARLVLNIALSLDGFIADPQGGFDWIKGQGDRAADTDKKFSFDDFLSGVGTLVMGSKAYEDCPAESIEGFKDKQILVASSRPIDHVAHARLVHANILEEVLALKASASKDIWLFGGGGLVEPFLQADVIDDYIIGIIPVILGQGIPLFRSPCNPVPLLLEATWVDDGITILKYTRKS